MSDSLPGFNDERPDPICGVTHLGNGYRAYHPLLMRFTCPDDLSPFGAGGINPYAYCVGDPINRADPSGHVSAGSLFGILAGVIGGVMLGVLTAGLALPATLAIDAAFTVAVTGAAMGIDHQRLSSMGGGDWGVLIGGSVLASVGGAIAGKVLGSLKGARGRPFGGLMMDSGRLVHSTAPLESLPPEVFDRVASHLDGTSQQSIALTSRRMHALILGYEERIETHLLATNLMVRHIDGSSARLDLHGLITISRRDGHLDLSSGLGNVQESVRWMQDTIMGRTNYRASLIINRGLPYSNRWLAEIGQSSIRFHPRSMFYTNSYESGSFVLQTHRERDVAYAAHLNTHMPETSELEELGYKLGYNR